MSNKDVDVPGEGPSLTSKVLNLGMAATEKFAPLKKVCQHVCAFHFYAHDMSRQVEAHHYCSHLSEEVRQCVIYDSDASDARLIGVEYIISRRLFDSLPEEEKKYWHSHTYEGACSGAARLLGDLLTIIIAGCDNLISSNLGISRQNIVVTANVMSGQLYAPRVPVIAENEEMKKLIDTYGKTWHMWQVDRGDPLPFGPPQLMMAFTADNQLREDLVADRDSRHGKNTAELREARQKKLTVPPNAPSPAANHWQTDLGKAWQTSMERTDFKR